MSMLPPQPPAPLSPAADRLARQPEAPPAPQAVRKGAIVIFPYSLWKNDATPCVMVSGATPYMIKGINLHYLTFSYVKRLLAPNANNAAFSYYNIKADQYIVSAFRSYLVRGIMWERARVIDANFLLRMMAVVRSFDPLQIRAIRQEIERQLYQGYPQAVATQPPTTPV